MKAAVPHSVRCRGGGCGNPNDDDYCDDDDDDDLRRRSARIRNGRTASESCMHLGNKKVVLPLDPS